jgi:opacity protein-like surface antigen
MKNLRTKFFPYALFTLAGLSSATFALNPQSGIYGGAIIGGSYILPMNIYPYDNALFNALSIPTFNAFVGGADSNPLNRLTYNFMGLLGFQLGYRCNKLRFEGQFLFNSGTYDSLTYNGVKILTNSDKAVYLSGQSNIIGGMANFYYDMLPPPNIDSKLAPYVGFGVGYVTIQNNLYVYTQNTGISTKISTESLLPSSNSFAGQLIAGLAYHLDDFSFFSLDFRLFSTANIAQNYANGNDSIRYQFVSGNLTFNGLLDLG